jgi:hypothetical protein
MENIKIPEGEKFFLFLIYVGLAGAALIMLIDYQMKRQLLNVAKEIRGAQRGQGGYDGANRHSGNLRGPDLGGMAGGNDAGMEEGNAVDHPPFPVRSATGPIRDASGRFATPDPDTNSGNGSAAVQPGNQPVES